MLWRGPQRRSGEFCRLQRQPSAPDVSVPGSSQGLGCVQVDILSAPLSPDSLSLERRGEWRGQETTMAAPTTGTTLRVHCCDDRYNPGTLPFQGEASLSPLLPALPREYCCYHTTTAHRHLHHHSYSHCSALTEHCVPTMAITMVTAPLPQHDDDTTPVPPAPPAVLLVAYCHGHSAPLLPLLLGFLLQPHCYYNTTTI